MVNRYLLVTALISSLCFCFFLAFAVMFWLDNREVKLAAQGHYEQMQAVSQECLKTDSMASEVCKKMAFHRTELDKRIQASAHYDSLTRLFIAFAVFIPLVAWALYWLTRAIFR